MKKHGILDFKGKQYRYRLFLCDRKEKQRLMEAFLSTETKNSPFWFSRNPKRGCFSYKSVEISKLSFQIVFCFIGIAVGAFQLFL